MKRIAITVGFLFLTAAAFGQTPSVTGVFNGASYVIAGLPNASVAQGSVIVIRGSNLGPTVAATSGFPLQPTLGGTTINITSGGNNFQALPFYSQGTQIAALLPSRVTVGTGSLTVVFNGATSSAFPIQIVQNSFGSLALNQAGSGAALVTDANYNVITALNPATPGEGVILWGTGLGPITADETQAPPAVDMTQLPLDVYVGTTKANVLYRGRSGCCAGLDQVNFTIPAGQLGCNVSLAVKINSNVSNFTTIPISNSGTCSDANGFPASLTNQLNTRGGANIGGIFLSRTTTNIALPPPLTTLSSVVDSGSASFYGITRNSFVLSQSAVASASIGGCVVTGFSGSSGAPATAPSQFTPLDAGPAITVTNPSGTATRQLTKVAQAPGVYSGTLSVPPQGPFLGPGTYTVSGTGGAVGPFQAPITGAPVTWTNPNITNVPRNQDLTVTWSGGTAGTYVEISGISVSGSGANAVGADFICFAPGSAGQFVVPAAVLLALPVSTVSGVSGFAQPGGFLFVGGNTVAPITIPNVDFAVGGYTDLSGIAVNYQ